MNPILALTASMLISMLPYNVIMAQAGETLSFYSVRTVPLLHENLIVLPALLSDLCEEIPVEEGGDAYYFFVGKA